jgi:predicted HicB family RNase H-like nuclease
MAYEQLTIRMDPELHKKLCHAADKERVSLSAFVVHLIDEWAKAAKR